MKKALKVTGIILGSLMILAVLMYAFGFQLIAKVYISNKYEHINCTAKEFPYNEIQTPENWKTIECEGLTLKVPEEIGNLYPDDESVVKKRLFGDSEKNTTIFFTEKTELDLSSIFAERRLIEKDIQKAMKSINYKYPENAYEFFDMAFNVTSDDFGILKHGKSLLLILQIAETKEMLYITETADCDEVYSFETENGIGFLTLYGKPNDKTNNYSYYVELYDKNNLNSYCFAIVKSTDKETALKIAETAEIAEE